MWEGRHGQSCNQALAEMGLHSTLWEGGLCLQDQPEGHSYRQMSRDQVSQSDSLTRAAPANRADGWRRREQDGLSNPLTFCPPFDHGLEEPCIQMTTDQPDTGIISLDLSSCSLCFTEESSWSNSAAAAWMYRLNSRHGAQLFICWCHCSQPT